MAQPPIFASDNKGDILAFFQEYKYVVVADALPSDDIRTLNAFVDRSKGEIPREWGPDRLGVFSHGQILVHHPELDRFIQPAISYDIVQTIMAPQPRFAQFDFRDVPAGKGDGEMHFHRDRPYQPTTETEPERPYECTYVCAIHYLSDVEASDPCFCVVPNSGPYETLEEARAHLGAGLCGSAHPRPGWHFGPVRHCHFSHSPTRTAHPCPAHLAPLLQPRRQPAADQLGTPSSALSRTSRPPSNAPFTASGPRLPKPTPKPVFSAAYYQEHVLEKLT